MGAIANTGAQTTNASQRRARMSSPKHRKQTLERPANIARAYQLRVEGLTERAIAERMGIALATAHAYVAEAMSEGMREIHERGRDYVRLELDRLEQPVEHLQRGIKNGNADAIREHRSLSESRRKLLGLDARPDADAGAADIHVTFKFPEGFTARAEPAHSDVRPSADVAGRDADGGRPAPVSLDRDGDEDR